MPLSPAEKQQAYRARQREAQDSPLERYVASQLEVTGLLNFRAPEKKAAMPERLARSEAYARWRWAEFRKGEVFSL